MAKRAGADGIMPATDGPLERGGTFRLYDLDSPYIFTVPQSGTWAHKPGPDSSVALENLENGNGVVIDRGTGRAFFTDPAGPSREPEGLAAEVLASVRYEPVHPDPPLRALAGGGAGQVLLQWTSHPQAGAVQRWQYRHNSSAWIDLQGSDGATRSYRVGGLRSKVTHEFQVRPRLYSGPGDAYATARIRLPNPGPSGIPRAEGMLEPGRTFLLTSRETGQVLAFDVPDGMLLYVRTAGRLHYDVGKDALWFSAVLRDVVSGSYLLLNVTTGEYSERYLRPDPEGRDVGALFDEIIASTRRVPPAGTVP